MTPDDVRELKHDLKTLIESFNKMHLEFVDFKRKVGERLGFGREKFEDIGDDLEEMDGRIKKLERLALKVVIIGSLFAFVVGPPYR